MNFLAAVLLAFAGRPTIQVSVGNVTASDSGAAGSGTVTSETTDIDVVVINSVGTVVYAYDRISGDAQTVLSGGTGPTPRFQATGVVEGVPSVATWEVTATDDVSSATDQFTVTLNWINTT